MTASIFWIILLVFLSAFGTQARKYLTKNGEPLEIEGPKSLHDKIAIVGAGISGIHMALLLKKAGFTNIDIIEKEDRIGGKVLSMTDDDGTVQELGACCIGPGYENNVIDIINRYAPPNSLVPRKFGSVWLDGADTAIPYGQYAANEIKKHFGITDDKLVGQKLTELILKYSKLHEQLFGSYSFELMPRPTPNVLKQLDCSYMEFLKKHDLDALQPLLLLTSTLQGYGYLDEMGAFYGLMWNTPYLLRSLLSLSIGLNATKPYLFKFGYQNLLETIVKKEHLTVSFKSRITGVRRTSQGVRIYVNNQPHEYSFLIWTPEVKTALELFKDLKKDEKKAFDDSQTDYLISSLVWLEAGKRASTPTSYWMDNMVKKRSLSVTASRNSREAFGGARKKGRFELAYQYSSGRPCKPQRKLFTHFYEMHVDEMDIKKQSIWRFFPHFSSDKLANGVLWDILEMQGKYNTWYIGSSVSFESLKSVMEYNKLLLNLMKPLQNSHL